jgi:tetratricopeptide (TPR) repeat protein
MSNHLSLDAALAQAESAFRRGDEAAAIALLDQAQADPRGVLRLREWAVAERRFDRLAPILARQKDGSDAEAAVARAIARQIAGDAHAALGELKSVLGAHPNLASAHHHAGRALHNLGRRAEALAALRVALQLQPEYPEARFSLAHALRAAGRLEEAAASYRDATGLRPGWCSAWLNLGITLAAADRAEQALAVFDHLLQLDPESIEAWVNRGLCLHVLGRGAEARESQQQALVRDPQHPMAHFYLGCLLNEDMDSDGARRHLEAALAAAPGDPDILAELAGLAEQNSELEAARRYVAQGLAAAPLHPGLTLEAARLARRAGEIESARARLLALDGQPLPERMAQQYWFERALTHDRSDEPAATMQALERAHAMAARSPRRREIDPTAFPRRLDAISRWLDTGALGAMPRPDDPVAAPGFAPAFLFGFPRSGTTLLDTMLDAHPQVASIEELPDFENAVATMLGPARFYPQAMTTLASADLARGHAAYAEAVRARLGDELRPVVLDKLPLRLLQAPLIHRLFPDAPLLFVLRHPCDVVLSNVMQQFRPNEAFIHFDSVEAAARTYDAVMQVWRKIVERLPLRLHYVRYEALVAAPEAELANALSALGLADCVATLDPETRLAERGRIRTNSYQQVAEPLYRRAAGRWQRYRPWLEPVLPLLRPHLAWMGYDEE